MNTPPFIDFALQQQALQFGNYTLKSGRRSPYFFNAAAFSEGGAIQQLGSYYAAMIIQSGIEFELLFGQAYKGIPLVTATAAALAGRLDRPVPFCHDRKVSKDHGEGGILSGADPRGRKVLLIDDVLTAGTAARQSVALLRRMGGLPVALAVALDRGAQEADGSPCRERLTRDTGLRCCAIINLQQLAARLAELPAYRARAHLLRPDGPPLDKPEPDGV